MMWCQSLEWIRVHLTCLQRWERVTSLMPCKMINPWHIGMCIIFVFPSRRRWIFFPLLSYFLLRNFLFFLVWCPCMILSCNCPLFDLFLTILMLTIQFHQGYSPVLNYLMFALSKAQWETADHLSVIANSLRVYGDDPVITVPMGKLSKQRPFQFSSVEAFSNINTHVKIHKEFTTENQLNMA